MSKENKKENKKENNEKKNSDDVDMLIEKQLKSIYPDVRSSTNPDYIEVPESYQIESESYVEVLGHSIPSKEHKSHKKMWIIVIVIVIIIGFLILIWAFVYSYNNTNDDKNSTNENESKYDRNYGSVISKEQLSAMGIETINENNSNSDLIPLNNKCGYGVYGDSCNLQAHDPAYYNIGNFDTQYTKQEIDGKVPLSLDYNKKNGSFARNSCTSTCNVNDNCYGVEYNHLEQKCSLIISDVESKGDFKFDLDVDTQIYMKNDYRPSFIDKVIGFKISRLPRYYVGVDRENVLNIPIGEIIKVTWIPTRIANHGNHIGFWSNSKFNIEDIILGRFDHVDVASGEYNIPDKLKLFESLYVLYISRDDYKILLSRMNY